MLDIYLLKHAEARQEKERDQRLSRDLGLGYYSVADLVKMAMAGDPGMGAGIPAPPPEPVSPVQMAPEDIGAAVGAALKAVKDKEDAVAAEQQMMQQQQQELEMQAGGAMQPPPEQLPPTFPPGQEPQAPPMMPPGQPPAAAPAAGGPPPGGAPPGPGGATKTASMLRWKIAGRTGATVGGAIGGALPFGTILGGGGAAIGADDNRRVSSGVGAGVGAFTGRLVGGGLGLLATRMTAGALAGAAVGGAAGGGAGGYVGHRVGDRSVQKMKEELQKEAQVEIGALRIKQAMEDSTKAMIGLPLAGAGLGAGLGAIGGAAKGFGPGASLAMRDIGRGAGKLGLIGGGVGLAATGLIGVGKLLSQADPSGRTLETAVQLAPALLLAGAAASSAQKTASALRRKIAFSLPSGKALGMAAAVPALAAGGFAVGNKKGKTKGQQQGLQVGYYLGARKGFQAGAQRGYQAAMEQVQSVGKKKPPVTKPSIKTAGRFAAAVKYAPKPSGNAVVDTARKAGYESATNAHAAAKAKIREAWLKTGK